MAQPRVFSLIRKIKQSYDWLSCVEPQKQRKTQCQGRIWTIELMPVRYIDTDVVRHRIRTPQEGYAGT